jgi:hypothetical protein
MSRAVYTFTDEETNQTADVVEFDLLDNAGCRAWQYAVMLNDKSRRIFKKTTTFPVTIPTDINKQYAHLKFIVDQLSTTEFKTDLVVPESFDSVTQDFMNLLHRHFTNSCATLWSPEYTNFDQQNIIDKILHDLNNNIHRLEIYVLTKNKLQYSQIENSEIWIINDGYDLGYDIAPFRQYHSYEPADLILDSYILGKTLLESFVCEDDPTSWDTQGHVRTNGGACLVLTGHREILYNSKEFAEWLESYGLIKHQTYADFPLGNFAPGHRSKMDALKNQLFKYSCRVHIQL